ncbi:hypothetical protein QQF64_003617 [Cirrhinus molitorella]|uniref:Uncharacterized protein n=1 Tax=Cirrhinus molitorella TaxID=172907 RepID=A0ABR3MLT7_9TELE
MQESEESRDMENIPDQVDGGNMSTKKKGADPREKLLSSSDWDRKGTSVPLVPSNVPIPGPTNDPIVISIGPPHRCPSVSSESQYQGLSKGGDYTNRHGWRRENVQYYASTGEGGVPKQTMDELKSVLRESSLLGAKGQDKRRSYPPGQRVDCKPDQTPTKSFTTFKPLSEARRASRLREGSSSWDSGGSSMTDGPPGRSSGMSSPTAETSCCEEAGTSHSDKESSQALSFASQSFISDVERIKQQIARENISFVRFEATDLHGVSRSKTVPARFFHVNASY